MGLNVHITGMQRRPDSASRDLMTSVTGRSRQPLALVPLPTSAEAAGGRALKVSVRVAGT